MPHARIRLMIFRIMSLRRATGPSLIHCLLLVLIYIMGSESRLRLWPRNRLLRSGWSVDTRKRLKRSFALWSFRKRSAIATRQPLGVAGIDGLSPRMWCPLNDTDALAQLLERVFATAFPGRGTAERNAVIRCTQRNVGHIITSRQGPAPTAVSAPPARPRATCLADPARRLLK
jgi:hypothetical protein